VANPTSPVSGDLKPLGYAIALDGANDIAALPRILDPAVVADETTKSGKLAVSSQASPTSSGLTQSKTISAATTNATSVKASAGQVYGVVVSNSNAAVRYLKLYNKASAPTVGTDVPVKTIMLPIGATVQLSWPTGLPFSTGIAFALTTGVADTDVAAVAADEHVVNIDYA